MRPHTHVLYVYGTVHALECVEATAGHQSVFFLLSTLCLETGFFTELEAHLLEALGITLSLPPVVELYLKHI